MPEMQIHMSQKQQLRVSPQMLRSTRILQMNAQELREYSSAAVEENPLLDEVPEDETQRAFRELCRQAGWIGEHHAPADEMLYHRERGAWDTAATSLAAFVTDQLDCRALAAPLRELCRYLAQMLDENGYLEQEDLDAVCALGVPQAQVLRAVGVLQSLEPAGVAARDLRECLLLQLRRLPEDTSLAETIVTGYLPLLGQKRWRQLAEKLHTSEWAVRRTAERIGELSPRPWCGEGAESAAPEYVTPDIFILEQGASLQVVLNDFYAPRLCINGYYAELLGRTEDAATAAFLKEKMRQARWVMDCMARRRRTLERCGAIIAETHGAFFRGETPCLAPLLQKTAAERLDLHESTLGRCIRGKYLQCRRGVYPLQYFFPHSIDRAATCSEQAVRVRLAEHICGEDPNHPLSDRQLSALLAEQGLPVARRTVAKYRQLMGIPAACGRRR